MPKRFSLSEEERAQRRAADREYVRQAVEALRTSDGWQQWLATRAQFRTYSLGNQLLIAMQRPTAVRVASFKRWLSLGYCVRKRPDGIPEGKWAIKIWAPCPPSKEQIAEWKAAGSNPEDTPRTFFKLTSVFGDDQVDPLPPPAVPAAIDCPIRELDGDDLAPTLPLLVALGEQIGSTVTFAAIQGDARGYYEPATRRIVIEQHMPVNQQAGTLIHELAHALLRAEREETDPVLDYAGEELVVESVSFTVVRSLGICPDGKSIPYLAAWSQEAELSVIEQTAGLIDRLAKRIEDAVHGTPAPADDVAVVLGQPADTIGTAPAAGSILLAAA